jgi:uncharacterized protein (DUF2384 family)
LPIAVHTNHPQPAEISRIAAEVQGPEARARELLLKAIEVLSDERKARAWFVGENVSLEDRRPVDVAEGSEQGYDNAYAVLGRIQ